MHSIRFATLVKTELMRSVLLEQANGRILFGRPEGNVRKLEAYATASDIQLMRSSSGGFERALHQLPDGGLNFGDGSGGWNWPDSLRFGGGDGLIAFGDALEESTISLLHAVALQMQWKSGLTGYAALFTDFIGDDQQQS